MKRVTMVFILFATFIAASCAVKNNYVPPHWQASGPAAAHLIVAMGFDKQTPCSGDVHGFHTLFIFNEKYHGSIEITVSRGLRWDVDNATGQYSFEHYALRPGKYFLTKPSIFGGGKIITPTAEVKIPFDVEPGKTYFLGRFSVYAFANHLDINGRRMPWGFTWLADKDYKIDEAFLRAKFPTVGFDNIIRLEGRINQDPYVIGDKALLPKICITGS